MMNTARVLLLIFASLGVFFGHLPAAENSRRPNIVLIVSDDQGYQDLGCYGSEEAKTPHLDRLAEGGVRLTDFYVTWPACTPSRGSLLTGRYPQRNGLYDMIRNDMVNYGHRYTEAEYAISPEMTLGMDLREVMISQPLKAAGYTCGVVGKWDSGRAKRFLPLQRGFDFYYGFANTGIDYWTHERYGVPSMFRGNERIQEEGYATDLFRREAVGFIRQNRDRPFFLYVPFNAPHSASSLEDKTVQAPPQYISRFSHLKMKETRIKYLACLACMDDAVGEILSTLRNEGLEENTLVVFMSDNGGSGPSRNTPLSGTKSTMYEGGIRVPMIARWPGRLPAGAVNHEFLTALEIFPTFIHATGAKAPEGVVLDGFDLLPVITGQEKSKRTEMFWEKQFDKAARVGNFKWIESSKVSGLFDLSKDIGETHDLSTEQPETLARVKARFENWKRDMDAAEPRGPFRDY
jgi:arylsulfatase A-like enzyme